MSNHSTFSSSFGTHIGGNSNPAVIQAALRTLNEINGHTINNLGTQTPVASLGNTFDGKGVDFSAVGGQNLSAVTAAVGIVNQPIPGFNQEQVATLNTGEPILAEGRNAKYDAILAKGPSGRDDSGSEPQAPRHVAALERGHGQQGGRGA